jgi:hypothetical protein
MRSFCLLLKKLILVFALGFSARFSYFASSRVGAKFSQVEF